MFGSWEVDRFAIMAQWARRPLLAGYSWAWLWILAVQGIRSLGFRELIILLAFEGHLPYSSWAVAVTQALT